MELVEVTVYYLEMLAPSNRSVSAPRDDLTVLHVQSPTVPYYRSLYNAVGKDFYWLSRRKMSDEALAAILDDRSRKPRIIPDRAVRCISFAPRGFDSIFPIF